MFNKKFKSKRPIQKYLVNNDNLQDKRKKQ